jgi:hypothetical protein
MAPFFRRGTSKIWFLPAVADISAPTVAEVNAGTDLSPFVNGISGFQYSNERIDAPNLASSFTPQIDGPDTVSDSSIVCNDDSGGTTTARTTLPKGTTGYLFLMPYGRVPTKRGEVWPAKSTGVNDEWSLGNDPARFEIGFAITAVPDQDVTIPALT